MKLAIVLVALWAAPGLRADVTIRYQSEFEPSAALGPIREPFMKTAQAGTAVSVRMKGNKAYTATGNWIEIFDLVKQEVTLIDPVHKTFAALPASQLADRMAGALPQATTEQMQDDMPMPAGMNQAGPSMKMVMHIWTAKQEKPCAYRPSGS